MTGAQRSIGIGGVYATAGSEWGLGVGTIVMQGVCIVIERGNRFWVIADLRGSMRGDRWIRKLNVESRT